MPRYLHTNVFTGEQTWKEYDEGTPVEDPETARLLIALTGLALSPWLYPLMAAVAGAVAFVAAEIADELRLQPPVSYAAMLVPAALVMLLGIRVEQRLGSFAPYRWLRHVMRLAVPVAPLYLAGVDTGSPIKTDVLGGMVFVAVIAQVILWFANSLRDDWHVALRVMRLRARSLAD
ncbi:MAG: hypothetical protein U0P30_18900 [Vicinamibacterales bacterium]